jgi:hypothetical protein
MIMEYIIHSLHKIQLKLIYFEVLNKIIKKCLKNINFYK